MDKKPATVRKVTLGGNSITDAILTEENKKIFQDSKVTSNSTEYQIINSLKPANKISLRSINAQPDIPSQLSIEKNTTKSIMDNGLQVEEALKSSELTNISIPQPTSTQPVNIPNNLKTSKISQYQKLSNNNSRLTKAHTDFLQARQDFSNQMSEIIQLQLTCAQNLLKDTNKDTK
jgi:hypothetical protein